MKEDVRWYLDSERREADETEVFDHFTDGRAHGPSQYPFHSVAIQKSEMCDLNFLEKAFSSFIVSSRTERSCTSV